MKTIILILLLSIQLLPQSNLLLLMGDDKEWAFEDNFSDGNYTGWTVSTGAYSVNSLVANPLSSNQYSLVCGTAGIIYTASAQAYGTWEFDIYKGTGATVPLTQIISAQTNVSTSADGYLVAITSGEALALYRTVVGTNTLICWTAASYIAVVTWHSIKVTRTPAGVFSIYIKGGAYGSEYVLISVTSGTNPTSADNTHTTSTYFVLDLDATDRISNVRWKPSI